MSNSASIIIDFVLEQSGSLPLPRRAQLLRATSSIVGNDKMKSELTLMADELEQIERRHQQLLLNFRGGGK